MIPFKQDSGEIAELMLRSVLVMAAIAAVVFLVLYLMRRYGLTPAARPGTGSLRVVESIRVAPRASIFVVQWGDSRILVGQSEHGMTTLARETHRAEPPA